MVSDIPWAGPLGAVRVGRVEAANSSPTPRTLSSRPIVDLDLVYVGNENDIVMYEGAAKEITEADFIAALKFAHEVSASRMIAAQKELAGQGRQEEARDHCQRSFPTKSSPRPRRSPATVSCPRCSRTGKLAREAAVQGRIQDEVGEKLVAKFGAEKVTDVRHQGRLLLHPEGSRSQPDPRSAASASTAATSNRFAPSPAKSASCPAPTVQRDVRPR
jgi:polyribonucleotide nucleotidyltransferase